jgi:hypothetical protein
MIFFPGFVAIPQDIVKLTRPRDSNESWRKRREKQQIIFLDGLFTGKRKIAKSLIYGYT